MIVLTALSLPFMTREPISLPPIVSVELIQITDKTNIPFAPKARKIIDKVKEEEKRVVSEQAPPSAKAKEKPDRIPLPKEQQEEKIPLRVPEAQGQVRAPHIQPHRQDDHAAQKYLK